MSVRDAGDQARRDLERTGQVYVFNRRDGAGLGAWWPQLAEAALLGAGQEVS